MSILDVLRGKNNKQNMVKKVEDEFRAAGNKEEAVENASDVAIEAIIENSESEEVAAMDLLKDLKKGELPNDLKLKVIIKILINQIKNSDKIAERAADELNLTTPEILTILKEVKDYCSTEIMSKLIEQIPDKDIREREQQKVDKLYEQRVMRKRVKKQEEKKQKEAELKEMLKDMYVNIDNEQSYYLAKKLGKIRENSDLAEVDQMSRRILARRAAIECKIRGNPSISSLTQGISAEEMMQRIPIKLTAKENKENHSDNVKKLSFVELVELEYEDIKDDNRYKGLSGREYEFDRNVLEQMILVEVAKNVINTYSELGIIDVPQSEPMKELSEDKVQFFIKQVQTYGEGVISESDMEKLSEKIQNQIKGNSDREDEEWINLLSKLPDDEKYEFMQELMLKIRNLKSPTKARQESACVKKRIGKLTEGLTLKEIMQVLDVAEQEKEYIQKEKEPEDEIENFEDLENQER